MQKLKKLFHLLDQNEIRRVKILFLLILVMSVIDLLGIASILPFMSILSNPELVESNSFFKSVYLSSKNFGVSSINEFLFLLGMLVFFLLIISLFFKTLTNYLTMKFIYKLEFSMGKRLIEGYLFQPYNWFLTRNSSELGKSILSEVSTVISQGMLPMMNLIISCTLAFAIFSLLLINNFFLTLIISLVFFFIYFFIYKFVKNLLRQIGKQRLENNDKRFKAVNEAFGAIKEVKASSLENECIDRFSLPAFLYANNLAATQIISYLPRYFIEMISFGGLLIISLYLINHSQKFSDIIPTLSLFAFAGYRLIPSLQQIYVGIAKLRFVDPALNYLLKNYHKYEISKDNSKVEKSIKFENNIELTNLVYKYPDSKNFALNNINLNIKKGSKVAFVGLTGSGKTTLIDIILFLLECDSGSLKVDGVKIDRHNYRAWRSLIGYVPQNIYLSDDTIKANIAFGVKNEFINDDKIKSSAKVAQINEFIEKKLPHGYNTYIGERGVRLSGGERQRLGIARVLYHNPQILIFDEATSALDNITEKKLMDSINDLDEKKTILVVAHRLNSIKNFNNIFLMANSQIVDSGNYYELLEKSDQFKKMVNTNNKVN